MTTNPKKMRVVMALAILPEGVDTLGWTGDEVKVLELAN
jgi:hypothetical protein